MAKEIRYRITLLRFLISTFFTLVLAACERGYEIKENNPAGTGGGSSEPARTWKRIFISNQDYNGNLGGKAGADAKCMADTNKPSSGTYKAMLVGNGREASPTPTDWVLAASTEYRQLDDTTVIGTTNASRIFPSPLTNAFGPVNGINSWTGLNSNWTGYVYNTVPATCDDWTDGIGNYYGSFGQTYSADLNNYSDYNWYNGYTNCSQTRNLICVEQ